MKSKAIFIEISRVVKKTCKELASLLNLAYCFTGRFSTSIVQPFMKFDDDDYVKIFHDDEENRVEVDSERMKFLLFTNKFSSLFLLSAAMLHFFCLPA